MPTECDSAGDGFCIGITLLNCVIENLLEDCFVMPFPSKNVNAKWKYCTSTLHNTIVSYIPNSSYTHILFWGQK